MNPLYIFDLDGTLALIEHRRGILDGDASDKWTRFYAACGEDEPNKPVVETLRQLSFKAEIWIFSGRSDEVREKTLAWLQKHRICFSFIAMRKEGDFTPDEVLKKRWLDLMLAEDRGRLVAVFDDRDKVVKMWRDAGVSCFQVAPGGF